ncbi:flagellar basal body rod protein FlgC [Granulosicoccus antarcticus]|uniref:Flagellar basal-body rod protein FlgC n=1 Tax=Granulosicoccus antarcticus IMCC3135 TaxID=1192854 RepID=A0A2Z2NKY0_9GAMM|nr:Flagellar basal-body rod protein FlgC [Granulosicoccus antarcticus IMCC3135]
MGQSIFDIAGSAMRAQSLRLNTTASNLANASSVSGTAEEAYRARHPVFAAVLDNEIGGVQTRGIVESSREPEMRYEPGHPLANDEGYIYGSNVDNVEEMANMMSASRSYQSNVEMISTVRQLMLQTLKMGDS